MEKTIDQMRKELTDLENEFEQLQNRAWDNHCEENFDPCNYLDTKEADRYSELCQLIDDLHFAIKDREEERDATSKR